MAYRSETKERVFIRKKRIRSMMNETMIDSNLVEQDPTTVIVLAAVVFLSELLPFLP